MRHRLQSAALLLCSTLLAGPVLAQAGQRPGNLLDGFKNAPATSSPWVFWMWLRVQTNRAAITADLEAMHAKGIEGAILYDSGVGGGMEASQRMVVGRKEFRAEPTNDYAGAQFTPIPEPPMPSWQPASREMVRFAASEAHRLGVKLVLTVGLASTSGDISLEDSQQRLVWSVTPVIGGTTSQVLTPLQTAIPTSRHPVRSMVPERGGVGAHPSEQKRIAVLAVPDGPFTATSVVDVSREVDGDGTLHWHAPAGSWRVYSFAFEPTHMSNAWGLYTDAMSATALDHTWDVTIGQLMREMTPDERHGLYGVEDDSWEAGASTWTADFAAEFKKRRGYDVTPWLPVLAGLPAATPAQQDGIRRDYYKTVAELIAEKHYAHLAALARENGLVLYSEAAGPNSGELDPELNFAAIDVPMGEFWMPSQHRPTPERRFLMHDAASAGHVYGHRVLGCESLTSVGPHWEESLFDLKNTVDQGFTEGCNLIVIHNFSQSPSATAKPGYVYFAGTHYGRNTTWWDQTPAFNAYLARIMYLLQQGHFVADALYYRGDGIGQLEQLKRALPLPGYDHDNINLDALVHRVTVRNGRLTLPDGMSYRMLVLPAEQRMALPALRAVATLVRMGATVVGPPPNGMDGLPVTPRDLPEFDRLVAQLWPANGAAHGTRQVLNLPVTDVLHQLHLDPDLSMEGVSDAGEIDWIHRETEDADIYFLASRWDPEETVQATFRVEGRQPELWDPVTGTTRDAVAFQQQQGRTTVPLHFDPRGSIAVIFRKTISPSASGTASSNEPTMQTLQTLPGPWHVAFDPKWGGPPDASFPTLVGWTKRPEEGIRYYSGTAVYRTSFTLPDEKLPEHLVLDLGEVHEEAEVWLNGVNLGVVWTKPGRVDVARAAKPGHNTLEVKVTNLWPNRLIGDASLPPDKRFTVTNAHKFSSNTPLLPSGLLGPVRVLAESR